MRNISDDELVNELFKRLQAKEKAYHDLIVMTKKLELLNNRLLESEQVKSHFLSNIRNEINNPLTSVLTMCELVLAESGPLGPDTLRSAVSTIFQEAFNLNFQLRNIFAAAELESGEALLSVSKVDLQSLVSATADSFRHKASNKDIKIKIHFEEPEEKFFNTDPEKVERILANLLSNAVEYNLSGKPVEVKVWINDGLFNFSVADQGVGIDEEHFGVIFERFRQLDTGVSKSHLGHGLGLSITKEFLDFLGGFISVSSVVGKGTSFTVTIPESQTDAGIETLSMDGADFFFDNTHLSERF
ncbi:MAG: HAMP domain-containing histidine kinase [Deltaproteobacteria bacterium]|nr:HAMP domain-containing histidine kinase [Deltaproteobacteria bacterium]